MDHDESGHETTDHECQTDAYCGGCNKLLPWPLYEIRSLDGQTLAEAEEMIRDMMADANADTNADAKEPEESQSAPATIGASAIGAAHPNAAILANG